MSGRSPPLYRDTIDCSLGTGALVGNAFRHSIDWLKGMECSNYLLKYTVLDILSCTLYPVPCTFLAYGGTHWYSWSSTARTININSTDVLFSRRAAILHFPPPNWGMLRRSRRVLIFRKKYCCPACCCCCCCCRSCRRHGATIYR